MPRTAFGLQPMAYSPHSVSSAVDGAFYDGRTSPYPSNDTVGKRTERMPTVRSPSRTNASYSGN